VLALRALRSLGFTSEAEGFVRFVQRSAAGRAGDLQVLFGIQGSAACPSKASSTSVLRLRFVGNIGRGR
jgi:hypothetical protein